MTTTFIILGVTIVLFVWGRWSPDLVALLSLLALALSGVIGTGDALAGFGNPTVVMIAALFVVGEGLSRTGVTGWGGKQLLKAARGSKIRLLVVVMIGTALLSAFISNTGTVATLLPAVVAAAWVVGSVPSKFLMPLAFAANTGGLLTLTGTPPNIVVAQTLEQSGLRPFSFFEFALIGGPLLVVAVTYMALVGRRILPSRSADDRPVDAAADLADLASAYSLGENQFRLRVRSSSSLIGKTAMEAALGPTYGAPVLRIEGREIAPDVVLRRDDILVVRAPDEIIDTLLHELGLSLQPPADSPDAFVSKEIGLAEVIPTATVGVSGQTISRRDDRRPLPRATAGRPAARQARRRSRFDAGVRRLPARARHVGGDRRAAERAAQLRRGRHAGGDGWRSCRTGSARRCGRGRARRHGRAHGDRTRPRP